MKTLALRIPPGSHSVVSQDQPALARFDFDHALTLRVAAVQAGLDVPVYLLAPEVNQLLHYLPDLQQQMLFATLWNTGARLNELLALTPASFTLGGPMPFVVLKTLKQRQHKGRPRNNAPANRIVPLTDPPYLRKMTEFMATFKPAKNESIWQVHENTVRNWLNAAINRALNDGISFSVRPLTPHTFRHSYCMNLIMHGVPLKVVQAYAGHARLESTELYTKVFALDVGRQFDVRFTTEDVFLPDK